MRYFKLENSDNATFDMTTEEFFFHDISGLGFEEDNSFQRVGPLWRLESSVYRQKPITGKICFTDRGSTTPYEKYVYFRNFISTDPLFICYWPYGLTGKVYRKRVRVSVLEKSEINKYGVIDERVEFTPYTAWFESVHAENVVIDDQDNARWIWDQGALWRDSYDDPIPPGGDEVRYRFGGESMNYISVSAERGVNGLTKLIIHGPAISPQWSHYVDGELISTGGIDPQETLQITENERLIVDNTTGVHTMVVRNLHTGEQRNVYSLRDFDRKCFIELKGGTNTVSVISEDGTPVKMELEGQLYHATV